MFQKTKTKKSLMFVQSQTSNRQGTSQTPRKGVSQSHLTESSTKAGQEENKINTEEVASWHDDHNSQILSFHSKSYVCRQTRTHNLK